MEITMTARPFEMPGDADLIGQIVLDSFQYPEHPEWSLQSDEADDIARQMRTIRRIWPLMRLGMRINPVLRDTFVGFIWLVDGQPAGTIAMQRRGRSANWMIGNVSTLPAFRRRGVGRPGGSGHCADPRTWWRTGHP